jgi:protease inhibitor Inh
MHDIAPAFRASVLILSLTVAGCSGVSWPGSGAAPAAVQPAAPPVSLAGRWMLSSPGRGQCHMTFGSAGPTAVEGTIAPEGGCPGRFYMSRKWTVEGGNVVMRDHTGQPLAQLSYDGTTYQGKATSGDPVALMR